MGVNLALVIAVFLIILLISPPHLIALFPRSFAIVGTLIINVDSLFAKRRYLNFNADSMYGFLVPLAFQKKFMSRVHSLMSIT